jgi:hypothetical protein
MHFGTRIRLCSDGLSPALAVWINGAMIFITNSPPWDTLPKWFGFLLMQIIAAPAGDEPNLFQLSATVCTIAPMNGI